MRRPSSNRVTAGLSGVLAALVALIPGAGAVGEATTQSLTASEAPAAWVAYAEAVTTTLSDWLEEDGEAATRVRAYLHATRPAEDQPTPPMLLKVWIDGQGVVERLEFTPFAHEKTNAYLRAAVIGRSLAAPPPDMLLPLRIAVQLAPAGDTTSAPTDQLNQLSRRSVERMLFDSRDRQPRIWRLLRPKFELPPKTAGERGSD